MMRSLSVALLFLLLVPSSTNALGRRKTKDELVVPKSTPQGGGGGNSDAPPNIKKLEKRTPRKKIRGRFGLPGRRRKKLGLSAVLFPGVSPEEFEEGEEIPIWVDLVESKKTHVPFEYYDLPTCPGPTIGKAQRLRKNLGAKLQGHNQQPSPYDIRVLEDRPCTATCMVKIGARKARWLRRLVERQYRIHVSLDSLPVLMKSQELSYAVRGYPVGFKIPPALSNKGNDLYYLYNHIKFTISYREDPDNFKGVRVVGFEAHPVSIAHEAKEEDAEETKLGDLKTCGKDSVVHNNMETFFSIDAEDELSIIYSYEVIWVESETQWSNRWDIYMLGSPSEETSHMFSVVNALMIASFLSAALGGIMIRSLKKDISAYNATFSDLDTLEEGGESGWKLMHGDVFRPPANLIMLLCVATGTGAQIGASIVFTIFLSLFGFLSPMDKGQMLTTIIMLYVLSGSIAGYCSSRLYKFFQAKAWKRNTILTATAFPGVLVSMFLFLDIFLRFAGAATAVNFLTILALFLLWVCVATPLVFIGSFFGYRAQKIEVPVKTNQIARVIPDTPWYIQPPYSLILVGIVPFGSICVETYFIMGAIWLGQMYYIMGVLLVVVLILMVITSEMSIVMCYLQLCSEDHRWWWRSFLNSSATGGWLFVYALWFLTTNLKLVGVLPTMVYLTYMSMVSMAFALFCGSVGFFASFWFNRKIFGALKVD